MAAPCSAEEGAAIAREAADWLGTPYQHQTSVRGAGADCLGLLRGIWRARYGAEPETAPAYTPDWSEPSREEGLLAAARRHLIEIPTAELRVGDVLLFRMRRSWPAKHLAIVADMSTPEPRIIHAYSGHGVVASSLGPSWRRRIAAAFRFPAGA